MPPTHSVSSATIAAPVRHAVAHFRRFSKRLMTIMALSAAYALPSAHAGEGENLLTKTSYNHSACGLSNFETSLALCPQPVASWSQVKWGTNTAQFAIAPDSTQKNTAKLTVSNFVDGAAYWRHAPVSVKPSSMYRYRVKLKTNATTTAWAEVEFQLSNGNYRYLPLSRVGANTSWATFTDDFYTPSDAVSATVYVFLRANGSVTIDEVAVIELAPPTARSSDAYLNYALKRPLVSIVFDDGTGDIWNNAIPLLNAKGYKTTQFVVGSYIGTSGFMASNHLVDLNNAGHELASHTWTHRSLLALNSTELHNETSVTQYNLRRMLPSCVQTNSLSGERCFDQFAYPYGDVNQTALNKVRSSYRSARGTDDGLNTLLVNNTSTLSAQSMQVKHRLHSQIVLSPAAGGGGVDELNGWLNNAKNSSTWLVLLYHRVNDQPDAYGLTPTEFSAHLSAIEASGACVTPMHEALNEIQFQNTYQAVCGKPSGGGGDGDCDRDRDGYSDDDGDGDCDGDRDGYLNSSTTLQSTRATEPTSEQITELNKNKRSSKEHNPSVWRKQYKEGRFSSK